MMTSYKDEHQRFLSGHTGTSFSHLALVFSSACISCVLRDSVIIWVDVKHRFFRFIIDFIIIVVPSLLTMTLLSDYVFSIFICFTSVTISLFFIFIYKQRTESLIHLKNTNLEQQKRFVTYFRSIVSLLTAIAILAVDFQVFPRIFAKTEEFGFGMMDFGVGYFVISNAIVSPEACGKNTLPRIKQMKRAFISSIPLLILGFARLISIKGTDYHEHVTEYGVHWNFFFTLAALKTSSTFMFCITPNITPGISALLLLCLHQLCLSHGLSTYIIFGADGQKGRNSLIDANREGIFSLPGYIALYMMGVQLGKFIFQKRSSLLDWLKAALYLCVMSAGLTFIMNQLHLDIQLVSRRFVNAAYVFGTMSFSCITLTICLLGDITKTFCMSLQQEKKENTSIQVRDESKIDSATDSVDHLCKDNNEMLKPKGKMHKKDVCLLEAINFNSLLFFLLANLMTGFVNMSMSTIYASSMTAMLVLILYSFLLCSVTVAFYVNDLKTKIW